jgi:hypothetical protein
MRVASPVNHKSRHIAKILVIAIAAASLLNVFETANSQAFTQAVSAHIVANLMSCGPDANGRKKRRRPTWPGEMATINNHWFLTAWMTLGDRAFEKKFRMTKEVSSQFFSTDDRIKTDNIVILGL